MSYKGRLCKALKTDMTSMPKSQKLAKAQSAMEYLMTYGWSILIIAIVLAVLYYLGVFNTAGSVGTSCTAAPGYLCQAPTLTQGGTLTFNFGWSGISNIYNVEFACTATANALGPFPMTSFNSITTNGIVIPASSTGNAIIPQQTVTISALPCYGASGNTLGSQNIGAPFTGSLWLNYTVRSGSEGASNPWLTTKIATLRLPVS